MEAAMKSWELDNDIVLADPVRDALYNYSPSHQNDASNPWKENPHYFRHVRISAIALIKMVMHARSGGSIEIMGLMQGYADGDTIVVTDAFALPVEGTETRVNAQEGANEYMVQYLQLSRDQGSRQENAVGWYHSHPGYGCWLSGIDVETQKIQQLVNEPFVAVVIDPDRTISAGRVDIGAFRTYPNDYRPVSFAEHPPAPLSSGSSSVPPAKAEDFGAHASRYYSLEVSHFKSTLDSSLLELLWSKYWVQTLSQNPLLTNRDFGDKRMLDLGSNIREASQSVQRYARSGGGFQAAGGSGTGGTAGLRGLDAEIDRLVRASRSIVTNEKQGLMAVEVKAKVFGSLGTSATSADTVIDGTTDAVATMMSTAEAPTVTT
ncbi:Mov34-domain-containing protein [Durotheca rogersii]|uniref:Mov34-domain-containing protein n=1 Tax=Durotheca rogersii TaxID=419775 RepID=UPI0022205525|nr:Mov34-domain-containing protein [Durotheca rogersii]KAI5855598.1 Mov34-domain-containing protein [Durotheca rogersii]